MHDGGGRKEGEVRTAIEAKVDKVNDECLGRRNEERKAG